MIRKGFFLAMLSVLLLYLMWVFFVDAIRYDPYNFIEVRKAKPRADSLVQMSYTQYWDKDIHEKNLFSPFRSYIEPKPVSAIPPPPPPRKPELALRGIILDSFGEYVAYVEIDKAKALPLRKGDKAADIEVITISDRKVVLQWNAETITLTMEKIKTISGPGQTR